MAVKPASAAKINHHRNIESIISKGQPSMLLNGKYNPDWILWYRASNGVTSNVAKAQLKKRLTLISEGKEV